MNLKRFLIGTIIVQALLVVTKVVFMGFLNMESWFLIAVMWLLIVVILIAMERRQGILNYLEDFLLTIIWTALSIVIDLIITVQVVGTEVLRTKYYWITYLITVIALVVFHKKEHVANRN